MIAAAETRHDKDGFAAAGTGLGREGTTDRSGTDSSGNEENGAGVIWAV